MARSLKTAVSVGVLYTKQFENGSEQFKKVKYEKMKKIEELGKILENLKEDGKRRKYDR